MSVAINTYSIPVDLSERHCEKKIVADGHEFSQVVWICSRLRTSLEIFSVFGISSFLPTLKYLLRAIKSPVVDASPAIARQLHQARASWRKEIARHCWGQIGKSVYQSVKSRADQIARCFENPSPSS